MERTMGIKLTSEAGKPLHVLASSSRQLTAPGKHWRTELSKLPFWAVRTKVIRNETRADSVTRKLLNSEKSPSNTDDDCRTLRPYEES
jgi:hypothetical protein